MSASTHKKVLVARFERETLQGFLNPPTGFDAEGVELATLSGGFQKIPYSEIKIVCFVRDFDAGETWKATRSFAARPKNAGLWVRLRFRDEDVLEGIVANNLMLLEPGGFSIVPPDPTFQNQRIYVPRAALLEVQVLGVIGSPLRRRAGKPAVSEKPVDQLKMFD